MCDLNSIIMLPPPLSQFIKIVLEADLSTGEYEIYFYNISNPGEPMDYAELKRFMQKLVEEVDTKATGGGVV